MKILIKFRKNTLKKIKSNENYNNFSKINSIKDYSGQSFLQNFYFLIVLIRIFPLKPQVFG